LDAAVSAADPSVVTAHRSADKHSVLRAVPAAVVIAALVAVTHRGGVSLGDIALYALRLVATVLLPGVLLSRLVRTSSRTGIEDLAVGFAVGTLVQVPVWWLFLRLGLTYWIWPVLVVAAVALWPSARRRVMATELAATPLAWSASVAATCLTALAWLRGDFLRWSPPMPGAVHTYYNDLQSHMSIAAETKHAMPPTLPQVAGEPLYYHWLAHVDMGLASKLTGIELSTVVFQLWTPVILLAGVVVVAACGSRISGRLWAGPLTAVFLYVAGEIVMGSWTSRPFAPMTQFYSWASPSQTIVVVLAFPAIGVIVDHLRGEAGSGRQLLLLGLPLFGALALAKSSELPVFIGGSGVLLLVAVLRRERDLAWRAFLTSIALSAVFLLSVVTIYGRESGGLSLSPLYIMRQLAGSYTSIKMDAFPTVTTTITVLLITGIWGVTVLARTWGVVFGISRWRSADPGQILLVGILLTGVGGYLMLKHPGGSQVYFLICSFALGALASAWAICERAPRLSARAALVIGVLVLAAGLVGYFSQDLFARTRPATGFLDQVVFLATPVLLVVATAVGLSLVVVVAHRRGRLRSLSVVTVVTAAVIAGGIPSTIQYTVSSLPGTSVAKLYAEKTDPATGVTDKGVAAARWIRDHTDPDTVVATNRHCLKGQTFPGSGRETKCEVLSFWVSAWSERRVLVEGWAFSSRSLAAQIENGRPYQSQPFWDRPLLKANDGFFEHPTSEGAAFLCERGARFALLDRRYQPDLPKLEPIATLVFSNSDAEVYRLPC
jgi:hypothetical protein